MVKNIRVHSFYFPLQENSDWAAEHSQVHLQCVQWEEQSVPELLNLVQAFGNQGSYVLESLGESLLVTRNTFQEDSVHFSIMESLLLEKLGEHEPMKVQKLSTEVKLLLTRSCMFICKQPFPGHRVLLVSDESSLAFQGDRRAG
jgi:hypothetical protein